MQRASAVLVASLVAGCAPGVLEAHATLPRGAPPRPLAIYLRDADLPEEVQLENAVVLDVRAGAVEVRVRGVHPTAEVADPGRWEVWLEDDAGILWAPTGRHSAARHRLAVEWARDGSEASTLRRDRPRLVRRNPALDVHLGEAAYEFAWPGLAEAARLTVVVRRDDVELRYVFDFAEGEPHYDHHGRSCADVATGTLVVPGEVSRVAGP